MPQNAGTVARVAPSPRKQPRTPSDRYISWIDLMIFALWADFPSSPPATCMRVLTKSSGAQTTDAKDPDPTPDMRDETKFCRSAIFVVVALLVEGISLVEASSSSNTFIFRDPDQVRRRRRGDVSSFCICCCGDFGNGAAEDDED
mmetsp:Transcript_27620/g.57687  ORF Transcript_27620/g.57687 Transcript_27620/m.57687 type:complete len:145 (+) Transcript_27620:1148-1582(+)